MRVLVIQSKSILVAGITSLLQQQGTFEVERFGFQSKVRVCEELDRFRPDVIILDTSLGPTKISSLLSLLEVHQQLRLLVISLENNKVQVYEKQDQSINTLENLIKVIHGEYSHKGVIETPAP